MQFYFQFYIPRKMLSRTLGVCITQIEDHCPRLPADIEPFINLRNESIRIDLLPLEKTKRLLPSVPCAVCLVRQSCDTHKHLHFRYCFKSYSVQSMSKVKASYYQRQTYQDFGRTWMLGNVMQTKNNCALCMFAKVSQLVIGPHAPVLYWVMFSYKLQEFQYIVPKGVFVLFSYFHVAH